MIDACLQLHGGYGYIEEYEVARSFVDARITRIWAGTNEIMKEVIGRSLGLRGAADLSARRGGYPAGRRRIRAARSQRATSSSPWL